MNSNNPTGNEPASGAPVRLKRVVSRTQWDITIPSMVGDRVVLAASRAYGYRGKNVGTASDVLRRKGWELVPW